MARNSRRAEQLELDYGPRRIPEWKILPVRVREEVFESLTELFRDRFKQRRANQDHEQEGSKDE